MRTLLRKGTRSTGVARLMTLVGAATLVACQDSPTSPRDGVRLQVQSLSGGPCGNLESSRIQSMTTPPTLAGVTVTANFPGAVTGLPWNILRQMEFPLNSGAGSAPCLNSPEVTYIPETLYVAPEPDIPAPEGVNAEWWASLSPRERKALLNRAEEVMRLYPNRYSDIGSVIARVFEPIMLPAKVRAKIRAIDFYGGSQEAELFAGGVYGCALYQNFVRSDNWHLSNAETLDFVIDLVTAFAEAEFAFTPLRGLRFGRNGTFGAAMAAQDGSFSECGRMLFDSVPGGRIDLTDPYFGPHTPPPPVGPPGGGYYAPPPPPDGNPIGWYDQ